LVLTEARALESDRCLRKTNDRPCVY